MSSNRDLLPTVILLVVVLGGFWLLSAALALPNSISKEAAVARFYEQTQAEEIIVIRHSNNSPFTGNTREVTFELLVDGKPVSGVCTSGMWSEMVCRVYEINSLMLPQGLEA